MLLRWIERSNKSVEKCSTETRTEKKNCLSVWQGKGGTLDDEDKTQRCEKLKK